MSGQQRCTPQTLHLKWYITAVCLKVLYMIDVGNDGVTQCESVCVGFVLQKRKSESRHTNKILFTENKQRNKKGENAVSLKLWHQKYVASNMGNKLSETMNQINYFDVLVIRIN